MPTNRSDLTPSPWGSSLPTRIADEIADDYFKLIESMKSANPEDVPKLRARAVELVAKWAVEHQRGRWHKVGRNYGDPISNRRRGSGQGCRPLEWDERIKICAMYRRGVKTELIGAAFNCSTKLVYRVLREHNEPLRSKKGRKDAGAQSQS